MRARGHRISALRTSACPAACILANEPYRPSQQGNQRGCEHQRKQNTQKVRPRFNWQPYPAGEGPKLDCSPRRDSKWEVHLSDSDRGNGCVRGGRS